MTLKEFHNSFSDIFNKYEKSLHGRNMRSKPLDRIVNFIEAQGNIRMINVIIEDRKLYRPCIKIDGKEKFYDVLLPLNRSKAFLVSKALEYIKTGEVY